jgi:hypothetical protein
MKTSTNLDDTPKMVVEDNVSSETLDRIRSMQDDKARLGDIEMIPSPENASTSPKGPEEINLDAPDTGAADSKKPGKSEDESKAAPKGDDDDDDGDDDGDGDGDGDGDAKTVDTVKLKLHGVEREYTHHEIKQALGRQSAQAKQLNELQRSEEMSLGTLLAAAKKGDKAAAKKVHNLLLAGSGKETADDLLDELEDVEGDFDENAVLAEKHKKEQMDAAFSDVKDSVDFGKHMDTVNTEFKEMLPEKVWQVFTDEPVSHRAMYDLAASGRAETLIGLLNDELSQMPLVKQLEIQSDPKLYGEAFTAVVKRDNARIAREASSEGQDDDEDDGLKAVSTNKSNSRETQKPQSGPDFDNMSRAEFLEWRRSKGLES